jgi:hypothetical protein
MSGLKFNFPASDLHRIGNVGHRDLEIARHMRGGADRLAGIVQRPAYESAVGPCTVGLAVKVDFERELGHWSVSLLFGIDTAWARRYADRMRRGGVGRSHRRMCRRRRGGRWLRKPLD